MDKKFIKHGNHTIGNDYDGYMYNFNTSNGYTFNSHFHKCYEFIHVIHGHLIYTVEGSEYMLSDGDLIMTKPEEFHSFSFPKECVYQREFLHIYPGFIENSPELLDTLNSRKSGYFNRFPADMVKKYKIDEIFRHIEKCCTNVDPETDILVLSYTLQLISAIRKALRLETPEKQEIIVNKHANKICDYIDHHYREEISIEKIAKSMFVSPSYLSRAFKKETGMTIKTYINMRRITRAKNLIPNDRSVLKHIYIDCGFSDYSTFFRAFKKYVGMSPEEFKSMHNRKSEQEI